MKTAFIYSDDFSRFSYGSSHPLKPFRLKLTYELIKACGLLAPDDPRVIVPVSAKREDLLAFHSADYINMLEASNSGKELPGAAMVRPAAPPVVGAMLLALDRLGVVAEAEALGEGYRARTAT